jgi:hypothetical protein
MEHPLPDPDSKEFKSNFPILLTIEVSIHDRQDVDPPTPAEGISRQKSCAQPSSSKLFRETPKRAAGQNKRRIISPTSPSCRDHLCSIYLVPFKKWQRISAYWESCSRSTPRSIRVFCLLRDLTRVPLSP